MKKSVRISLIFCLVLSVISVPSFAFQKAAVSDGKDIRPMFTYIDVMTNYFDIDENGKASAEASIAAMKGYQVKVEVELQRYDINTYSWKTIKTWSDTDKDIALAGGSWYVTKGTLYRSVAKGYVYIDGKVVEEHEMISKIKYYE